MRARNIKPGFYKNEDLAECSVEARLLAPGLWMMADKEGRLEDRPKRIKGEIFPFDNFDVDLLLSELDKHRHIKRYEVEGGRYIQILAFKDHQNPHHREKESEIPPFIDTKPRAEPDIDIVAKPLEPEAKPRQGSDEPPLNPDSLNPDSSTTVEGDRFDYKTLVSIWNEILGKVCPKVQALTDARKKNLRLRFAKEFEGKIENWKAHCELILKTPFCCGENDRGWRAGLDWALEPSSIVKVREGSYGCATPDASLAEATKDAERAKQLRDLKRKIQENPHDRLVQFWKDQLDQKNTLWLEQYEARNQTHAGGNA